MKQISLARRSLLVGDDLADGLIRYAALLSKLRSADHVRIRFIRADGEEVEAHCLLNPGTALTVQSTRSNLPEPDNARVLAYLHGRLRHYSNPLAPWPEPNRPKQS